MGWPALGTAKLDVPCYGDLTMFAYSLLLFLLFASCQPEGLPRPSIHPADGDTVLTIPAAPAPMLDGNIDNGEWEKSLRQDLAGGGHLYLQHHGDYLFVAMHGVASGWGHVYVLDGDSLRVLHASAALGMAVYHQVNEIPSPLKRAFVWEMRDPALTAPAKAARTAYLDKHGWVATIGGMGTPAVVEYQIEKRLLGSASVLAVVYAATPEDPLFWPASLQDATLDADLVRGDPPAMLTFNINHWQAVIFDE